jgi:hypothetical protein|tara:strand:+ start:123 stop:323 length:201 start_codon:yes stop_codon:yes gene_type:complete
MNKPDTSNLDYKYGIFAKIGRKYTGPDSNYWTNNVIREWCNKNNVHYELTDKRIDLIERIKQAGYK